MYQSFIFLQSYYCQVVFSKQATVKLLVAYWKYSISNADQYLKSLLDSNVLCSSSKYNDCAGKVEIKYYKVPGFNLTGPAKFPNGTSTGNIYPGFTRVNTESMLLVMFEPMLPQAILCGVTFM